MACSEPRRDTLMKHRAVGMLPIPDNAIDDLLHQRVPNPYNKGVRRPIAD
jgi:hypothetical protein